MKMEGKVLVANLMIHSYEFLRIILTLKRRFGGTDNKIEFPSIFWSVFVASGMEKVMFAFNSGVCKLMFFDFDSILLLVRRIIYF